MSLFVDSIDNVISIVPKYLLIKLSFGKINEWLNLDCEKDEDEELFNNGDILFDNISYSYDDYHSIFNGFSLRIGKNDHLVMKGKSGCGKSTLCKFLNRSIDEYKGNILINGINIKDYSLKTIRKNIIYVSQRECLFSDTIRNNILMGLEINNDDFYRILRLTKVSLILDRKSFKLDSMLFDGGFNLSGGERQRIILARALVRKPKILILDEALNQVDLDMERSIVNELDNYLVDTTLIYVSHNSVDLLRKKVEFRI